MGQGWQPMSAERFGQLFAEFLKKHPQIDAVVDFEKAERTIDSTNATIDDWNGHAKMAADAYDDYDGFVFLGGTDTMDYMGAAYSEILWNLQKPVIPVGSLLPLTEVGSNAPISLLTALLAATHPDICGVNIAFGEKLFSPMHVVKMSTEHLHAFDSPGWLPPAVLENDALAVTSPMDKPAGDFQYKPLSENYLPVVHFSAGNNDPYNQVNLKEHPKAVLVFGHGNGNIPQTKKTEEFLKECNKKDISVFVRTRVPDGNANAAYEAGTWFLSDNVMPLGRMTEAYSVMALQRHLTDGLEGKALREAMEMRMVSYTAS
jgi:L-asparaginase